MEEEYRWLEKKTPRSVDQLRLWNGNPRLDPEEKHITLADFAEDLISDDYEKKHFLNLIASIASQYIPADPIVVWKDTVTDKFYVAEGNRRILALKLLNNPEKAPKSIRAKVRELGKDYKPIEKVKVYIAPSFEDAEWYINQRNNVSSLQRPWSRIQQQRWIETLYKKYGNDMMVLSAKSSMTPGEIESIIRNLKIIDLIKSTEIRELLSEEEYKKSTSYKFPVTILERFFSNKEVRQQWGMDFVGTDVKLQNRSGFLNAYAALLRNIVSDNPEVIVDTRTVTSDLDTILEKLPKVDLSISDTYSTREKEKEKDAIEPKEDSQQDHGQQTGSKELRGDMNRNALILQCYTLNTTNYRLEGIFKELKRLSITRYTNATAASIRVFLDLSVLNWLQTENLITEIQKKYKTTIREITLKNRLTFVEEQISSKSKKASSIISKLLNPENNYSLDVLNGYQHSNDTCYLNKQFLNGFWDFLFPLFEVLLDIKEEKEHK